MTRKMLLIIGGAVVMVLCVVVIVVLAVVLSKKHPDHHTPEAWDNYRLSNTTLPLLYTLTIKPYIMENRFEGNVSILINVQNETSVIYLHQKSLQISRTALSNKDGNAVSVESAFPHITNEYWVVTTSSPLTPGNYTLEMGFSGSFLEGEAQSQALVGFYRSSYVDKTDNQTRYMATTKFEPTYARRAFPCFDEPNKKAKYAVTLIHDRNHPIALSNMPLKVSLLFQRYSVVGDANWTRTEFETSITMSTYLVCFIASDFKHLTQTASGVTISTYAPQDRINETQYALDVATKVLSHYDVYFGLSYKKYIPKLVPDFVSGAMENWGIITFRETNLLYSEGLTSASQQKRIAEVVAHELAHMWFGNIVTMDWWDDLWLNEGFATFMAYTQGMGAYNPKWQTDSDFVVSELQTVMPKDAALSSHPIIVPIWHPDDITAAFDTITYNKGSSVLRMLDDFLNRKKPDSFKLGIQKYLKDFEFKNARTNDLWAALQQTSGFDVKSMMDTWTLQMGFPVLSWDKQTQTISQKRFLSNPNEEAPALQWAVPLTYRFQNGTVGSKLMPKNSNAAPLISNGDWIKINSEEKGYYRVNYDNDTWGALTSQLLKPEPIFAVSDRCELVDDSFALAAAGLLTYDIPFKLIKFLEGERVYQVWESLFFPLGYIKQMLRTTDSVSFHKFNTYIRGMTITPFNNLPSGTIDTNERLLVQYVSTVACYFNNSDCMTSMKTKFASWIADQNFKLSPDYRTKVFQYGIQGTGEHEWNITWGRFLKATIPTKYDLQYALAQSTDPKTLRRYLELAWNTTLVRRQDYFTVVRSISGNPVGTQLVYDYVKSHWSDYVGRFTLNDRYFGRLISSITASFNTQDQYDDLQTFFEANPEAGAGAGSRKQALANIQKNIDWVKQSGPNVKNALERL